MKKAITKEQIEMIRNKIEETAGTEDFYKYYVFAEYRWDRWRSAGWVKPSTHNFKRAYLKTIKNDTYIYVEQNDDNDELVRYSVTDNIKELLNL